MSDQSLQAEVLLRSEDSGTAVSAVQLTVPAGWGGPRLHHHAFDEAFYVLEGTLSFQVGEDLVAAGANTLVLAPGGSVHTLANLSEVPASYLLLCTPAGFERRFDPDPTAGSVPETIFVGEQIDAERRPSRTLAPGSRALNVLVRSEETSGRLAVMDNAVGPDVAGPALHRHEFDELFYVLEGELTFQLGEEVGRRRAGELAFAPRGAHHTWANHSGAPARMLIVCTPAGLERYLARMAAGRAGVQPPAWTDGPIPPTTVVGPKIPRS